MHKKFLLTFFVIIILVSLLCVSAVIWGIPGLAQSKFGPPTDRINKWQRFYLSISLIKDANSLNTPANPHASPIPFEVELGQSPTQITQQLQQNGLISNAEALLNYLIYKGLDTTIQAGNYELTPQMTAIQIAHALQDATPTKITFNVLPGWRLEEIAASMETSGLEITAQDFLNAAYNPPEDIPLAQFILPNHSLEGFMFPGTYQIPRQSNADELVAFLSNNFITQIDSELIHAFQQRGLNLYQAVTLASIIQREAVVEKEMPIIASVFYNRLAADMRLESDPTVQYAIGYDPAGKTWWKNPLTKEDLKVDSPYNTYLYKGLPPGPISNPGLEALSAVAHPADTPYYYFRAKCDGSGEHFFAETFDEHLENACP